MHGHFWVYIMASKSGTLYTGMTGSLDRCVFEHKHHLIPGFTTKYHCTRLIYFEEFSDPSNAIAREKQIKGWLRAKKIALIESMNPRWEDLAQHWGAQTCPPGRSTKELNGQHE
jgi:putative endonuclease